MLWWNNQYILNILCVYSLNYVSSMQCTWVVLYSLWPVWLYHVSPHYLINNTFRKNVTEHKMCVLMFCVTFVWQITHSKRNWEGYGQNFWKQLWQIKILFRKKLRADWGQEMLAIIRCRIFCLPDCYPKI